MHSNRALVIVPTYNEAENIEALIDGVRLSTSHIEVLVVDDNSPDGTARIVERVGKRDPLVHLLKRQQKDGLAAAYLAGFSWGLSRGYDRLLQMDADHSHSPKDVPRLLKMLETKDVAVGCRYMEGGGTIGWSALRKLISRGGNAYAQTVLAMPYQDLTGGFNGWRRNVLERIELDSIRSRGYAFQVEMKYRAHKKGFLIGEVPILFSNRKFGHSKMSGDIVWEAAFRVIQLRRMVTT